MKSLEKRLTYLFTGEIVAVATFTFVYCYHFSSNHSYTLLYLLLILNFILLQGSLYWFVKWRKLKTKRNVLPKLYKHLNLLRNINLTLIVLTPLILTLETVISGLISTPRLILIIFVLGFVIIEYINYFHIQLTNYKNGRWKKSAIAKEIHHQIFLKDR